ncbi:hypothetical protein V6N13_074348 [Hibiscus sabdariffa]|uniref:Uncharacterized protein n=1 Tax=Hibiscus sabdariffa TaxID=183260 RepID=A0ABR2U8Y6_9ROSI
MIASNVELSNPQILNEEACQELILANPLLTYVAQIVIHYGMEMQLKGNEPTEFVLDTPEHGVMRKALDYFRGGSTAYQKQVVVDSGILCKGDVEFRQAQAFLLRFVRVGT